MEKPSILNCYCTQLLLHFTGCGVMGQHGGPNYAPMCAQALPRLVEVIQGQGSREPENINPTENAISAVTKILKWNASAIDLDEILPPW